MNIVILLNGNAEFPAFGNTWTVGCNSKGTPLWQTE